MITKVKRFQSLILIALALGFVGNSFATTNSVRITEVTPHVLVFATSSGNVVASVGPDGALLVGTPSAASTAENQQHPCEPHKIGRSLRRPA